MCFSATVSFSAAAVLGVTGIVNTIVSWKKDHNFLPLSFLLFFFAIQQFSEGVMWSGPHTVPLHVWAYIFLFFAFFMYPWYVSFCVLKLTEDPMRKKRIKILMFVGMVFGALLYLGEWQLNHLTIARCAQHIQYYTAFLGESHLSETTVMFVGAVVIVLYVFFTSAAFFISDMKWRRVYGWIVILASILSFYVYTQYFVSVWCFYAIFFALFITIATRVGR